jgi:para-nitrobenzyl esterase
LPEFSQYGAFHSSEIPYVFHNQQLLNRPWEEIDHKLSELMSSYWVNFIRTGNPNGENLPEWPAEIDRMMRFNEKSYAEVILSKDKLELFLDAWKNQ